MLEGESVEGNSNGASSFYTYANPSSNSANYALGFNPFETSWDAAEDGSPAGIGGLVGQIAAAQVGSLGASIIASVQTKHYEGSPASLVADEQVNLRGNVTIDGRFDVIRATGDGNNPAGPGISHTTSYDGRYLSNIQYSGEVGNIHRLSGLTPEWVRMVYLRNIQEVYNWISDPFDLPLYSVAQFQEYVDPATGLTFVDRIFDDENGFTFVGERYEVSVRNGVAFPLRHLILDVAGFAWTIEEYSDYYTFRDGDWRPRKIIATVYSAADVLGSRVVTITNISTGAELTPSASTGVPSLIGTVSQLWVRWTTYQSN